MRLSLALTLLSVLVGSVDASATAPPGWQMGPAVLTCECADAELVALGGADVRLYFSPLTNPSPLKSTISHDDGKTWTEEPGDRLPALAFPDVVTLPDGSYRLYFQRQDGQAGIGSARSTDGLTWTDEPGVRLAPGGEPDHPTDHVGGESVERLADGTWLMAYRGDINQGSPDFRPQSLYWATSADGLTWTKRGLVFPSTTGPPPGMDGAELVTWDDGTVRLYFSAFGSPSVEPNPGVQHVVYTGNGFTQAPVVDLLDANGVHPADPTLAKYGGRWHLFYGTAPGQPLPTGIYEAMPVERCVVPRVVRKALASARRALAKAHCATGTIRRARSKKVARGHVVSQSLRPGTRHAVGTKVALVVSRG